jgi:hypothetical protein
MLFAFLRLIYKYILSDPPSFKKCVQFYKSLKLLLYISYAEVLPSIPVQRSKEDSVP